MNIIKFVVALCFAVVAGCATNDSSVMSLGDACEEQAVAWCALTPPARAYDADCKAVYRGDCLKSSTGVLEVDVDQQNTCLHAILDNSDHAPNCVPDVCRAMWVDAEELAHFCRV